MSSIIQEKQYKAAGLPLSGFLPVDHPNSTTASKYWASKALFKRDEANTLELVINKLDVNQPLSHGTSRLSAFASFIGDLHSEAFKYDSIARKNQYRKMIMSESRLREQENFDISTIFD